MHRRSLPVVACPLVEQVVADGGHCRQCDKRVHDLSAMTQRQARGFLRRNRGRSICVAYRATPDGRVRFAPSDAVRRLQGWSLPMLLGALGGCASLGRDLEVPEDETCLSHRGRGVDCDEAYAGYGWEPDAFEEVPARESEPMDEVVPPDEDFTHDDPLSDAMEGDELEARTDVDSDDTGQEELRWVEHDVVMGGVLEPMEEASLGRRTRKWQRKARRAERRARRS